MTFTRDLTGSPIRPVAWCLIVLAIVGGTGSRTAAEGRLHVVLVADPDPPIREDVEACVDYVKDCLRGGIPEDRLVSRPTITGWDYTRARIRATIDDMKPDAGDAILFYFCGHGFIDDKRETYITPRDGGVHVSTVTRWLEGAGGSGPRPRLVVALFDCCSNLPSPGRRSPFQVLRSPGGIRPAGEPPLPLFNELFFRPAGTFAMVASAPGEYALTKVPIRDQDGGLMRDNGRVLWNDGALFTGVLTETLTEHANESLGWHHLHEIIARDVNRRFQGLKRNGVVVASNNLAVGVTLGNGQFVPQQHQTITIECDRLLK